MGGGGTPRPSATQYGSSFPRSYAAALHCDGKLHLVRATLERDSLPRLCAAGLCRGSTPRPKTGNFSAALHRGPATLCDTATPNCEAVLRPWDATLFSNPRLGPVTITRQRDSTEGPGTDNPSTTAQRGSGNQDRALTPPPFSRPGKM